MTGTIPHGKFPGGSSGGDDNGARGGNGSEGGNGAGGGSSSEGARDQGGDGLPMLPGITIEHEIARGLRQPKFQALAQEPS